MKDIITVIGFLAVGYVFFSMWGKGNAPTIASDNSAAAQPNIAEAGMYDYEAAAERRLERPNEVSRSKRSRPENREIAAVAPTSSSKNSRVSTGSIRQGIDRLADLAIASAVDQKNLVPAGASLTLLLLGAEKGKQLSESNLRKVVNLLRSTKQDAPRDDQRYFKYTSNSEKWFEGLQLDHNGGYNISDLLRIYDQYNLRKYDQDVMAIIASNKLTFSKKYEPATAAPAMKGNASDAEVRRNHAFAKNRWVEKEAAGSKAELKFVAAAEKDESSASALRRKVASLGIGESLSFSDPDAYHTALKELIALENGYDTWKKYEANVGKDQAKRTFRKRSEKGSFFSSGGLKITRQQ